jgi:hypothetical protein
MPFFDIRAMSLLIVTSYNASDMDIKVQIPKEAIAQMGLDPATTYIARDSCGGGGSRFSPEFCSIEM